MKGLLSVVCAFALVYSCYGLYHLKQKGLGVCDLRIRDYGKVTFVDGDVMTYARGHFVREDIQVCIGPLCKILASDLYRPDLANGSYVAKHFSWSILNNKNSECTSEMVEMEDMPTPYDLFDDYFEFRNATVFYGISCYIYKNASSLHYYGNDTIGAYYGGESDLGDELVQYFADSYTPKTFTFDPKKMKGCDADAYAEPAQDWFDKACKDVPPDF